MFHISFCVPRTRNKSMPRVFQALRAKYLFAFHVERWIFDYLHWNVHFFHVECEAIARYNLRRT